MHFQHLSAVESVEALAYWKAAGAQVSGEASPHHLTLTDEAVRSLDTRFKMNPPLRAETDRQALIAGLRDGTIDCIATDHAPHARHEKEVPFEEAPMGVTGSRPRSLLYTELVLPGVLSLALLVERMTAGAALLDLPTPRIAVGEPANLALVDLDASGSSASTATRAGRTTAASTAARCDGVVRLTVAAGTVAHRRDATEVPA